MVDYLREIKFIGDSLASIKSQVFQLNLIQYPLNGLGLDYDNFVYGLSVLPGGITFDEVNTRLLF